MLGIPFKFDKAVTIKIGQLYGFLHNINHKSCIQQGLSSLHHLMHGSW
jgi:hypothetical protein